MVAKKAEKKFMHLQVVISFQAVFSLLSKIISVLNGNDLSYLLLLICRSNMYHLCIHGHYV